MVGEWIPFIPATSKTQLAGFCWWWTILWIQYEKSSYYRSIPGITVPRQYTDVYVYVYIYNICICLCQCLYIYICICLCLCLRIYKYVYVFALYLYMVLYTHVCCFTMVYMIQMDIMIHIWSRHMYMGCVPKFGDPQQSTGTGRFPLQSECAWWVESCWGLSQQKWCSGDL